MDSSTSFDSDHTSLLDLVVPGLQEQLGKLPSVEQADLLDHCLEAGLECLGEIAFNFRRSSLDGAGVRPGSEPFVHKWLSDLGRLAIVSLAL